MVSSASAQPHGDKEEEEEDGGSDHDSAGKRSSSPGEMMCIFILGSVSGVAQKFDGKKTPVEAPGEK